MNRWGASVEKQETIEKGQMEILEPKSMINERSLDQFNRRLQMAEEGVIELENIQ